MQKKMLLQLITSTVIYICLNECVASGYEDPNTDDLQRLQEEIAVQWRILPYKEIAFDTFKSILANLTVIDSSGRGLIEDITICGVCQKIVRDLQQRHTALPIFAEALCNLYIALSTWTQSTFCRDMIRLHMPLLKYIIDNSRILEPEYACSVLLQNERCYYQKAPLRWRIGITPESQKRIPQVTKDVNSQPLKILHLTDFHISTDYEVGGISNCGFPVCCKKGLGNPIRTERAGQWGDYDCDIPLWLFGNTLRHINHTHQDLDLVYFTGDIIDHTVWKSTKTENSELIYFVFKSLFESFPNIPVLPQIGNHEATPLNAFHPPDPKIEQTGLSSQWLYDLAAKVWRTWLSPDALKSVQRQGYYSFKVNDKFKVISLNNNVCYNLNWWLLLDTTFLAEQLKFLRYELEKSEQNEQFVHIIAHVPPGNKECIEPWEKNYNHLIRRFAHIIKGQFFGHTHTDELKIFYDGKTPINVGYNGASLTPYQKYNPNYKIVTVDSNTYEILDIDTYIFNLTEANANPHKTPKWFKLYSTKETYGLSNFSANSFNNLIDRMFQDPNLSHLYWRFYVRDGDASLREGCDSNCIRDILCKIVTTETLTTNKDQCQ